MDFDNERVFENSADQIDINMEDQRDSEFLVKNDYE